MDEIINSIFDNKVYFKDRIIFYTCEDGSGSSIGRYKTNEKYIDGEISLYLDVGDVLPELIPLGYQQIFNANVKMRENGTLIYDYMNVVCNIGYVTGTNITLRIPLKIKSRILLDTVWESSKSKVNTKSPKKVG